MPIFEYRCGSCGKTFEFYQRGKDIPRCPSCGSTDLRKMLSRFAAHVKGGDGGSDGDVHNISGGGGCAGCAGGSCATCGK